MSLPSESNSNSSTATPATVFESADASLLVVTTAYTVPSRSEGMVTSLEDEMEAYSVPVPV